MATGITETGFNRKTLAEILQDKDDAVRGVFGANITLTPQSPQGQINGVLAESDSNLWELTQDAYDSFNPSAARGIPLSNLVQLNGVTRKGATSTRASMTLTGVDTSVIPAGTLLATGTGIQFATEAEETISGATATVYASAVIPGDVQVLATQINTIVTAVTGLTSVNNAADAVTGTNEETDEALRLRRAASVALPSETMLDSIFSGISSVDSVGRLKVIENDSDVADGDGNKAHSIHAIVEGGLDADIAAQIYLRKAAGITMNGNTTVQVLDTQSIPHDIKFTRPTETDIYIIVNLTTNASFPVDGADQIKQAIIDFAAGSLVAGCSFGIGEDVIYSRLFTPINSIKGHQVDSLYIDLTPSPAAVANLSIDFDAVSKFTTANIAVNV